MTDSTIHDWRLLMISGQRSAKQFWVVSAALAAAFAAAVLAIGGKDYRLLAIPVVLAWITLVRIRPAVGMAIWLLAASDSIPFVRLSSASIPGSFRVQDVLIGALLVAASLELAFGTAGVFGSRVPRWLCLTSLAYLSWWLVTVLRTWVSGEAPVLSALLFGRDLCYIPLVAVAALIILRRNSSLLEALPVIFMGAAIFSLGLILSVAFGVQADLLVHSDLTLSTGGLTRFYTPSHDLVTACFPVVLWSAAFGRPWRRWLTVPLVVLLGAAVVLQLTRANYVAVAVGFATSAVLLGLVRLPGSRRFSQRGIVAAGSLASLIAAALAYAGLVVGQGATSGRVSGAVLSRIGSLFSPGLGSDPNWSWRLNVASSIRNLLRGDWPWGLGFVHPELNRYPVLPGSDLRNPDVGVLGTIAVMGAIGAVLQYMVVVGACISLFRRGLQHERSPETLPVQLGILAFLIGALVSSVTLVVLSSPSGATIVGFFIALALCFAYGGAKARGDSPVW